MSVARPGSSTDAELVAALHAGERDAFARVFDALCDRVHDAVVHVVRDPARAGDAVHETFAVAWRKQDDLDETAASPAPWLLRLARSAALDRHNGTNRRMSSRGERRPARVDVVGNHLELEDRVRAVSAAVAADDEGIVDLLWDAAAVLPARDLSVVDLELRHGLRPSELARILGMHGDATAQLLDRLHDRLDDAIRSRVLWRSGSPSCSGLAGRLRRASIERFGPDAVRIIQRHVAGCGGCGDRQTLRTAPRLLFAALPLVPAPQDLRHAVATSLLAAGVPLEVPAVERAETDADAGDEALDADSATVIDLDAPPAAEPRPAPVPTRHRRAAAVGALVEGPTRPALWPSENPTALRATLRSWASDDGDDDTVELTDPSVTGVAGDRPHAPAVAEPAAGGGTAAVADVAPKAGRRPDAAAVDPTVAIDLRDDAHPDAGAAPAVAVPWSAPGATSTDPLPPTIDGTLTALSFGPDAPTPVPGATDASFTWSDDDAAHGDGPDGDRAETLTVPATMWGPTEGHGRVVRADHSAPLPAPEPLDAPGPNPSGRRLALAVPLAVAATVAVLIIGALSLFAMGRTGNNSPALAEINTSGETVSPSSSRNRPSTSADPAVPGAPMDPSAPADPQGEADDPDGAEPGRTTRDTASGGSPTTAGGRPGDRGAGPSPDPGPGPAPGPGPSTDPEPGPGPGRPVTTTTSPAPTTTVPETTTTAPPETTTTSTPPEPTVEATPEG